ncbi:dihydrofolate reductase [Candidatus Roizmanbacteria bacterium]|jgi:dihydrofolate reductase|nr:dihydrofolate reductase [Candidatus Roizmanbacteria bacterium]
MKINIIAAIGKNRELGKNNRLLWHISDDLKRFKKLTQGNAVIMGRKTFESLEGPLPNRLNIVITRNKDVFVKTYQEFISDNFQIFSSLPEAINYAKNKLSAGGGEVFVIGGGEVYRQALPLADRLYLTLVETECQADTYFPDYSSFNKTIREQKGESEGYKYTFLELEK